MFNIRHTKMNYCNTKVCIHYNMGKCRCKFIGLDHTGFCMNFTPFTLSSDNLTNNVTETGGVLNTEGAVKIGF